MKILLSTLNAKYIHMNLAIRLLYNLNKDDQDLSWKEFTIKESKDEIADYCSAFDVVAFSCYIWNITPTLEVIRKIKILNPNIKILLGGPEVSYDWQNIISNPDVDFIIIGEGEIPFKTFLEEYPNIELVPNLVYKKNSEVIYNQQQVSFNVEELRDIYPYQFDDYSTLSNRILYLETSRGCPYKCEFCLASLDNKVRYLPMDNIKNNLMFMMKHGRVIKFLDRTFNIKKEFTLDIFQFILEHHRPENVFQFEITADILHPDIIRFIDEKIPPGLFRFEIGIQTVNQKSNLEVSRKQNFEKTKSIIYAVRHKIELHLDLIVGLPLDYWGDIKYSFEEVFKLFAPELQLGFLKFLKGTPVRYKHEQHEYVFDPNPPYQIIESKYLSKQELHQITELEHALEIYWNKKRAINTLKYVTLHDNIFDFLMNLGHFFGTKRDFHQYSLDDVCFIISEFVSVHYPDDKIIRELIAIDYFTQHKVKPKVQFLEEISRKEKQNIIDSLKLNHHKFRYIILPISFSWNDFYIHQKIVSKSENIILQYDGRNYPKIIS